MNDNPDEYEDLEEDVEEAELELLDRFDNERHGPSMNNEIDYFLAFSAYLIKHVPKTDSLYKLLISNYIKIESARASDSRVDLEEFGLMKDLIRQYYFNTGLMNLGNVGLAELNQLFKPKEAQ